MVDFNLLKPDLNNPNRIRTPHAAVLIWNYDERIGSSTTLLPDKVDKLIISTVSLVSIKTNKAKGDPQGSFQLTLAPTRNWVSTITPGSWCAILMSNTPISQKDFSTVDPSKLKMIGKIDTVRVGTKAAEDGARQTMYYVSGVDWGYIFNNIIYIDSNLARPTDPINLGNSAAIAIQNLLFGENGVPKRFTTSASLNAIMETFGKGLFGFSTAGNELNLLANAIYNFNIPREMSQYLRLLSKDGIPIPATNINSVINVTTGALNTVEDQYFDTEESYGFIDPFSLQGAHTFWQVLLDNSNPTMNEMIAEMRPESLGTKLVLYNRIKPFAIRGSSSPSLLAASATKGGQKVLSYFQNVRTHELDPMTVIDINAGTNWKDKYNFVEIKPQFSEERILEVTIKTFTQGFDQLAFQREGFRPLIFNTKHLPGPLFEGPSLTKTSWDELQGWVLMLKVWYFDTHKMLNGTITFTGQDPYIAVGDNIKFDAQLINPNKNFSIGQNRTPGTSYVLAHVENVSHSFEVKPDGGRSYITTISFVRGIIVNQFGIPVASDVGAIDGNASLTPASIDRNSSNTIAVSDISDPDKGLL